MATNTQGFDGNTSREFSDDAIRRFLLGDLNAIEQPLFERRLFTDLGLDVRVGRAELELADDYAFDRLSAGQRLLFEERFLLTADRQQKLHVSKVLRDRFSTSQPLAPLQMTVAQKLKKMLGLDRPVSRIAFGVLMLLLILGTAWLLIKEPRIRERLTTQLPRRSAPANVPRPADHPTSKGPFEHTITPSPMPAHERAAAPGATLVLNPGPWPPTSEMPTLKLPKSGDVVSLRLVLTPDQTGPYQAKLQTSDGSPVFSRSALTPVDAANEINFEVPSHLFKVGDYQINLTQQPEAAGSNMLHFYFRVR